MRQQREQKEDQQQQGYHQHKYDVKTDAELQEDEDFINNLAEATTQQELVEVQQELVEGVLETNDDTDILHSSGIDDNNPYPPPSRVCTDSDGDAGSVAAAADIGDDSTSSNSPTMNATVQDRAAKLEHAVSASNVTLSDDESPSETAGSAAQLATATADTASTSVDGMTMETKTHSDHLRYAVGPRDTVRLPIGERSTASATAAVVYTSKAVLESEKPAPVRTVSLNVATATTSLVGGSTEPLHDEIKAGLRSCQGTQYKTGRWTVEGM